MSTVNLMILGILKYRPANAYEVVRVVDEYKIDKWIRIKAPSIYQNLKKMHQKGYLFAESVREGEMPEKTYYSLTHKGEEYYEELMGQYSSCPPQAYENYLPVISNLVHVKERSEGLKMLADLKHSFEVQLAEVDFFLNQLADNATLYDKAILLHYSRIINAKLEWINEVTEEYSQKGFGKPVT